MTKHCVVIIGAGIAGLTCARELMPCCDNIDIVVLEASQRIGGRINSIVMDDGTVLELGAQFIHGTKNNPLFDFAVEKGIISKEKDQDWVPCKIMKCFHKDLCADTEIQERVVQIGVDCRNQIMDDFHTLDEDSLAMYTSVGDYMQARYDEKIKEFENDQSFCQAIKSVFVNAVNNEAELSGCETIYDLDVKGFLSYIDLEGDLDFVVNKRGYSGIVDAIAEDVLRRDCVKFGHNVVKIEDVEVDGKGKILIKCDEGSVFYADTAVVTISVEILKNFIKDSVFSPCLPLTKSSSVNKLCLGHVIKVFFKFKTPANEDIHCIQFYPSPTNFGLKVFRKYSEVYAIDRLGNSDWWLLWVNGAALKNDFDNNDSKTFTLKLFEELKNVYPTFPDLKIDEDSIIASCYSNNIFQQGAYSYLKVGATQGDILNYALPIVRTKESQETHLLFAGEMTDPEFYSTTHGAYVSGLREGKRIKSIYSLL